MEVVIWFNSTPYSYKGIAKTTWQEWISVDPDCNFKNEDDLIYGRVENEWYAIKWHAKQNSYDMHGGSLVYAYSSNLDYQYRFVIN
jgi:hypothetical protein